MHYALQKLFGDGMLMQAFDWVSAKDLITAVLGGLILTGLTTIYHAIHRIPGDIADQAAAKVTVHFDAKMAEHEKKDDDRFSALGRILTPRLTARSSSHMSGSAGD